MSERTHRQRLIKASHSQVQSALAVGHEVVESLQASPPQGALKHTGHQQTGLTGARWVPS